MKRTHGQSNYTRAYTAWMNMRARCNNPRNVSYHVYGGRGITVCRRWKTFAPFFADMGAPPVGLTLDRRNNDRGYSKVNCRWASRRQQNQNTRRTRNLTFAGKTQCIDAWERERHIRRGSLAWRIRAGWTTERALSTPFRSMAHDGTGAQ